MSEIVQTKKENSPLEGIPCSRNSATESFALPLMPAHTTVELSSVRRMAVQHPLKVFLDGYNTPLSSLRCLVKCTSFEKLHGVTAEGKEVNLLLGTIEGVKYVIKRSNRRYSFAAVYVEEKKGSGKILFIEGIEPPKRLKNNTPAASLMTAPIENIRSCRKSIPCSCQELSSSQSKKTGLLDISFTITFWPAVLVTVQSVAIFYYLGESVPLAIIGLYWGGFALNDRR